MARLKPEVDKMRDLNDVNAGLMEIGILEDELDKIDSAASKKIAAIKEKAAADGEERRRKIADISASIGAYAQYNRQELFKDRKTLELTCGSFGFRKSTSIRCRKTCVELLKKLGLDKYVRVKEEPDKDAMADLDDETLASVDAARIVKDDFFCEAAHDQINRELLSRQQAS